MDNERRKKLMETVKTFNKDNKSEVFTMGNEIVDTPIIPSGIKAFDEAIGGGVKRGGHTIIYGQFSVGKTALIMHLVANAQREGLNVCYVNTEKPISPDRFRFFGVDLDTLLYIEAPENAEVALEALRTLCKDKVIDLFIIDSTNGLCPISVQSKVKGEDVQERGLDKKNVAALPYTLSNFYNVVNAQVFRAKAAVVWIGQLRTKGIGSYITMDGLTGGNAQTFYAYQIIKLRHGQKADNPQLKTAHYFLDPDGKMHKETQSEEAGFDVVVKVEKTNSSKSLKQGGEIHIPFYYETGFGTPNLEEDKIVLDGTDEEKEVIREKLIEKGILKDDPDTLRISKDAKWTENFTPPTEELKEEPKKKRGRPSSKKEKK
jgi:RecA/RadA recombinase